MGAQRRFWLMKSEPDVYGIADLKRDKTTGWSGVRNYQARNFMQSMALGDGVLYYHSNATPSGVAGVAKVCRLAYPDPTQFDRKSEYYDAASRIDAPRWFQVDVAFEQAFDKVLSLEALKQDPKLQDMLVIKKGQRLSVQPVTEAEYAHVIACGFGAR